MLVEAELDNKEEDKIEIEAANTEKLPKIKINQIQNKSNASTSTAANESLAQDTPKKDQLDVDRAIYNTPSNTQKNLKTKRATTTITIPTRPLEQILQKFSV